MVVPFVRDFFLGLAPSSGGWEGVVSAIAQGGRAALSGLSPSAQAFAAVLLQRRLERPLLLVVADNRAADELRDAVETFQALTQKQAEERPLVLPGFEVDPYQGLSPHDEILERRALAQWKATQGLPLLLVPAVAAATRLAPPQSYRTLARVLRRGDLLDLDGLAEHLTLVGYRRQDPVELPGQYSVRGGLFDVFSPEAEHPVRIELFGDEIESLRAFDPESQRSQADLTHATLLPLTSLPPTRERLARLAPDAAAVGAEALPPGWEFLVPGAEGFRHSVFDLAPEAAVLVLEPEAVRAELERWWRRLRERHAAAVAETRPAPLPEGIFFEPAEVFAMISAVAGADVRELRWGAAPLPPKELDLAAEVLELRAAAPPPPAAPDLPEFAWPTQPAPRFHGGVARLIEEMRAELERGRRLALLAANLGEVERLADLFNEYGIAFQLGVRPEHRDDYLAEKSYYSTEVPRNLLLRGRLAHGFILPEQDVMVLGHADLFPGDEAVLARESAPRRSHSASFLSDFRDLAVGDYVVHVEHGIGRYLGLKNMDGAADAAKSQDFMLLEYAEGAKLYVPLARLDLVQKYRSGHGAAGAEGDGARVALDRLGGAQWQQRKARVRKAMQEMADELLKLYAARQATRIEPCGPDDRFLREFEDAFPYAETDHQARAIGEVRRDLSQPRPMDRLLVGDVGYGKTEVAMRAAFKIVSENRQAALLAPTTVLAFQHFETFKQRFAAFPVAIEMLSRFRTPAQQHDILQRLAVGKVDILIGTHRMLSKDVRFQNLGVLIVDEEQRFGVRHKERLKQLKREVHVLALSATPIPRTLNMSLAGLRDLSVIETPPKDRLAIQTVVAAWDEGLVQSALETELARGGQVYFVHNRVETIWEIAALVQRLVPRARVAVGHGQMNEDELERVMLRFIRHEADVLVATTIIENGLDIPLANTMIVNRADRLGLSELYQLRGRVGRSNRRAYAYLLVPAQSELTPVARKRLAAMREFSDLGAGFKIAALDLELRGAGNLLGGEQSGHIDAVGFDLYVRMLEQTVRELKGEEVRGDLEPQIQLGLDVHIPEAYIAEENQRLRIYKRLAEAEDEERRQDVERELADRYGPPPPPVRHLLEYAALKGLCRRFGIAALERKRESLHLRFGAPPPLEPQSLAELAASTAGAQLTPAGVLRLPLRGAGAAAVLEQTRSWLARLESLVPAPVA
ncbi:MAG: transcription-repair coupling factor [Terriglobales bacterium]